MDLIAYHTPWWRQIKSETYKYTIHINIDLLNSNGLIIKSRYYDFKIIYYLTVEITLMD